MLHTFKVNWVDADTKKVYERMLVEVELNDGFSIYERDAELVYELRNMFEKPRMKVDIMSAIEVF